MKVCEVMSRDVQVADPDSTLRQAATLMKEIDAGALPIGVDGRLIGMITDRDIAVRAVAMGLGPETRVREVMTRDVKYCFEDEDLSDAANNMGELQVRRLPVLSRDKHLVGIVSLGDIAVATRPTRSGTAVLRAVSRPGGQHNQTEDTTVHHAISKPDA